MVKEILSFIYQLVKGRPLADNLVYSQQKIGIIAATVFSNLLVLAILIFSCLFILRKQRKLAGPAVILIAFIELFLFSKGNLIAFPIDLPVNRSEAGAWLADNLGFNRFISASDNLAYTGLSVYWTHLRAREPFSPNGVTAVELEDYSRFKKELKFLPQNQGMLFNLADASGYAAIVLDSYARFWRENPASPNAVGITDLTDPKLDLTGVKYLVTGYPEDYLQARAGERFKLVYQDGELRIYENVQAQPRAFLTETGQVFPAQILSYQGSQVIINYDHPRDSLLTLTDNYYPGWQATVDGVKSQILPEPGPFRSLSVPAGKHTVEFSYRPASLKLGAIISLAALTGLITAFLWQKKRPSP